MNTDDLKGDSDFSNSIDLDYVEIYRGNLAADSFEFNDEIECGMEFSFNSILLLGESLLPPTNDKEESLEDNTDVFSEVNEALESTGLDNLEIFCCHRPSNSNEFENRNVGHSVLIYSELEVGTVEKAVSNVDSTTIHLSDKEQLMNSDTSSISDLLRVNKKIDACDESQTISIPLLLVDLNYSESSDRQVNDILSDEEMSVDEAEYQEVVILEGLKVPSDSSETIESSQTIITKECVNQSSSTSVTNKNASGKTDQISTNLYLCISIIAALIVASAIWVNVSKASGMQSGPHYHLTEIETGLFAYHECDKHHMCTMPKALVLGAEEKSNQPVPLIEPIPLALQARRALALMAEDAGCAAQSVNFSCLRIQLQSHHSKVFIHGARDDSAVLEWHIEAELNSTAVVEMLPITTDNQTLHSLLGGYGFNDTVENDLFSQMQSKWSHVHKILDQLQNRAVVDVQKLKDFEAKQRLYCTAASHKTTVAVIGKAKAGKSTFLNALLGRSVMPVNSDICTATITSLEYPPDGEEEQFTVFYKSILDTEVHLNATVERVRRFEDDCVRAELELQRDLISSEEKTYTCNAFEKEKNILQKTESISAYVSKLPQRQETVYNLNRFAQFADGRDDNILPILVDRIKLFVRSDILQHVSLVDTPGLGDSNAARNSASQRALTFVDGYIYLVSAQEMAPADVRKELNWIRDMAGDIPHVKMLSRVDEFTGWRRDARKNDQRKNLESSLIERRREYDELDLGLRDIPMPWNSALGVEIINNIITSNETLSKVSMNTLFDFLKGISGWDHVANILITDDPHEINSLGRLKESFHRLVSQSESIDSDSLRTLRLLILDSSGIVQSNLALKLFIHDVRTNSIISTCEKQYSQLLEHKLEVLSLQASRLKGSISKVLSSTNSTLIKGVQADKDGHDWSVMSVGDMKDSLNAEIVALRRTRDKLTQWKDYMMHYDIDGLVNIDIVQQVQEKWNAFDMEHVLYSKAFNSISTELTSNNYKSIEFTYCGYLNCSASVDLYHLFDSPYVQRYIKLLRSVSTHRFEEFNRELKDVSTTIGINSTTEFASIQIPDLTLGTVTGSMLGVQGTSAASSSWEHQSLFFRWECSAMYCTPANNESLPSILLKAVQLELEERGRHYYRRFQDVAMSVLKQTVTRSVDAFMSEITYQLQNIELQISNWEGSNIDSMYKQYTLLEADISLLQNVI